jgi:hypothetical protein
VKGTFVKKFIIKSFELTPSVKNAFFNQKPSTKMKFLLPLILLIHGIIHLMGFAKAFNYAEINQLTQPIPKK